MNLHKVQQIKETDDINEVNALIQDGWAILAIYAWPTRKGTSFVYSLGTTKSPSIPEPDNQHPQQGEAASQFAVHSGPECVHIDPLGKSSIELTKADAVFLAWLLLEPVATRSTACSHGDPLTVHFSAESHASGETSQGAESQTGAAEIPTR